MDHEVRIDQGAETAFVVEKIWEKDDDHYIPTVEEISALEKDHNTLFRNGVIAHAKKSGYSGQDDDKSALAKFLRNKCAQANAEIEDKTIYNWLNKDAAPSTNEKSRENIYKLCFALGMDDRETELFFLKNYLTRPFNYKNVNEAVYCFCLKQGLSYTKAQELIEKVHAAPEKSSISDMATVLIGDHIRGLTDEDELVDYLSQHYYTKEQYHAIAYQRLEELRQSCTDYFNEQIKIGRMKISYRSSYLVGDMDDNYQSKELELPEIKNTNHLIIALYSINEDERKYRKTKDNKEAQNRKDDEAAEHKEDLKPEKKQKSSEPLYPKSITRSWPKKQQLIDIKHNNASDEVIRKALIMFSFVDYCNHNEDCTDFDEFVDNTDELLDECGYVGLYPRNPYDWLFFNFILNEDPFCAMQDFVCSFTEKQEDPSQK